MEQEPVQMAQERELVPAELVRHEEARGAAGAALLPGCWQEQQAGQVPASLSIE